MRTSPEKHDLGVWQGHWNCVLRLQGMEKRETISLAVGGNDISRALLVGTVRGHFNSDRLKLGTYPPAPEVLPEPRVQADWLAKSAQHECRKPAVATDA